MTLHDAFSSAILTDWRRSHGIDRLDSSGSGDGGGRRLDWLDELPAKEIESILGTSGSLVPLIN